MTSAKHIHLIGICGTAMASLAGMLQQRGFRVTGSDAAAYPPMSDFLASLGIPVRQPFAVENLDPKPDLVVVGNVVSRGNVELEHILDQRIPFCSLPQILHDEFLRGKEVLVVAGTHGKTTTTSILAWIFHTAGLQPSFLIGGIAENFGSSFQLGQGKHFILEGDEYDTAFFDKGPKFLHYFPDSVILTSVEFDHADKIWFDTMYQGSLGCLDPKTGEIKRLPIERQTEIVLEQIKLCLTAAGSSLDNVIKCNMYCTDAAHFAAINTVYARYFPKDPPARSFVCVLPWHGPFDVEIDCIARA